MRINLLVFFSLVSLSVITFTASAHRCGSQAGGANCPWGQCCSKYGYCGTTPAYCQDGCQSQCGGNGTVISDVISQWQFNEMLKHRNDTPCPAKGFYKYEDFIEAAKSYPAFGNTSDLNARKRDVAAFMAQSSYETKGGWPGAPDGPYAWGYCLKEDPNHTVDYCVPNRQWPCVPSEKYYGRGPMQLSYNYNYGPAGKAMNRTLLIDPDLVSRDPLIAWKTALWFWMTPQYYNLSCHSVMTGQWTPSEIEVASGWRPGYGLTTNIITGGKECGRPTTHPVLDRVGFYKRYCNILGVRPGDYLYCRNQTPLG